MTATNWAPPLALEPYEQWRQFEVQRNCAESTLEPKDYMLALLPITIWAMFSGCKCGCGSKELMLHPISVAELKRYQASRRSKITVCLLVFVCERMGRFVD